MSFTRTFLAALAAVVLATPVFAADTMTTTTTTTNPDTNAVQTTSSTTTDSKVNVNTATAKDLTKVKGLTPAKAKAIVAYRKKHGDFKSVDDLANVKGLKKLKAPTMQQIQNQLTVE